MVKSIAGIVGESVIEIEGQPTAEQFKRFCESDFEIPLTDPLALEQAYNKRSLATEAAAILLDNYRQVQLVAAVLMDEGAVGRSLFRRAMMTANMSKADA